MQKLKQIRLYGLLTTFIFILTSAFLQANRFVQRAYCLQRPFASFRRRIKCLYVSEDVTMKNWNRKRIQN